VKKLFFITGILIIASVNIYGQEGKKVVFGVGGTLTNANIQNVNFYGEPKFDYNLKLGYDYSLNIGYNFSKRFAIYSEFQFSAQGQRNVGGQKVNGIKYNNTIRNMTLNYFNIPLFLKYTFKAMRIKKTYFRILAGPQFAYLTSAKQSYTRNGQVLRTEETNLDGEVFQTDAEIITNRFISYDISIAFDIGADIYVNEVFFISMGLRVNYGFMDINSAPYKMPDYLGNYKPSCNVWEGLYVSFNYMLDTKSKSGESSFY